MAVGSIPAAAYHRMSTDEGEAGIPHQRTADVGRPLNRAGGMTFALPHLRSPARPCNPWCRSAPPTAPSLGHRLGVAC
jgi:hypothetical protein